MGAFGQKRIYQELAWHHEATKLLSAYEKVFRLREGIERAIA